MKIIFIRHGEAEHNLPGWQGGTDNYQAQLTGNGRESVLRSAQELKQFKFVAAYASPMLRTQQTTQLVLGLQESPPKLKTDNRLADIYITNKLNRHWRSWQRLWRLRLAAYSQTKKQEHLSQHKLVGGQSLGKTIEPIAEFLKEIKGDQQRGPVLVVAHLHTFWALTSQTDGGDLTNILKSKSFLAPADWREIDI